MFEYVVVGWNWKEFGIFLTYDQAEAWIKKQFRSGKLAVIVRRKGEP